MSDYLILKTVASASYELIDSGDGEKLERFGQIKVRRPDPQALWKKHAPKEDWNNADASYEREETKGSWKTNPSLPLEWKVPLDAYSFNVKLTPFKHTGVFPEQVQNWTWIEESIKNAGRKISVLNLFGYTGGATLAAAKAGAEVIHVDGSKSAVTWAKKNAEISELGSKPIRWIVDDVRAFVKREIKRGAKYDGIIMDPPSFGRGAKGEVWKIEADLQNLLDSCKEILSEKPLFVLLNGYAAGYSALGYRNALADLMKNYKGEVEAGELVIEESLGKRLLPAGIFARFKGV